MCLHHFVLEKVKNKTICHNPIGNMNQGSTIHLISSKYFRSKKPCLKFTYTKYALKDVKIPSLIN